MTTINFFFTEKQCPHDFIIQIEQQEAMIQQDNEPLLVNNDQMELFETDQQLIAQQFFTFYQEPSTLRQISNFEQLSYNQAYHTFTTQQLDLPFTMDEFRTVIDSCRTDVAPGPDGFTYNFIKNLHPDAFAIVLNIYNNIWEDIWQVSIIKPVLKPSKSPFHLGNYRPLIHHSCLAKILEKLVYNRLNFHIEASVPFSENNLTTIKWLPNSVTNIFGLLRKNGGQS